MSDDEQDHAQINVTVPRETKEIAKRKLEHGGLTRVVRDALTRVAHGEDVSEREKVTDKLRQLRDTKREKISKRNQLDDEIAELEVKIERAENRLDELDDKQGEYEGTLKMIEQKMHDDGMHVFPGHGMIDEAASIGGCSPEDVIDDLRERNPDLPDHRFEEKNSIL